MQENKNILIQNLVDRGFNRDVAFQFEKGLFLLGRPDLMGLLLSLMILSQIGYINFKTQKNLAEMMGYSEPTFIKKRNELIKLKLLEIQRNNNKMVINLNFLSRLKFFKLPSDFKKQIDYIDRAKKSMSVIEEKQGQLSLSSSIYNINPSFSSLNNNSNKGKVVRFPKEDYDLILSAYKKYKGVGLFGPEVNQCRRAIKTMFKAERKPKEIIDFMKWLRDNETNQQVPWVRTWTIWTVQKKLPEFVAGKLKVKTLDEEYPDYE